MAKMECELLTAWSPERLRRELVGFILHGRRDFPQWPPTDATAMSSWVQRAALTPIVSATELAAPVVAKKTGHHMLQPMADGDARALPVHRAHHATKISPMIRSALEKIELPLVDHFMRERRPNILGMAGQKRD